MHGPSLPDPALAPRRSARRVWVGLVVVLVVIEACLLCADVGLVGSPLWRRLAWEYGGFWAGLLFGWTPNYAAQPVLMFVTYAFLHTGAPHLVGNALTLIWLGATLERSLKAARFALLYGASALGGAVGYGVLALRPEPMVGASGAIMGLVAVWIWADGQEMAHTGAGRRAILGMVSLRLGLILALHVVAAWSSFGALAWQAHLGGFVVATLLLWLWPGLRPARG